MDGVVFTLLVSDQFNIPSLFDKCMKWSIKHMVRVWPSREFSQLPNETHQRILLATIKSLVGRNFLRALVHSKYRVVFALFCDNHLMYQVVVAI